MNNLLRVYSNHADAPDIPNDYSLQRLLDRRIVFNARGKLRFEHIYKATVNDFDVSVVIVEMEHQETIDHGEVTI
jgi:hypothetical protein